MLALSEPLTIKSKVPGAELHRTGGAAVAPDRDPQLLQALEKLDKYRPLSTPRTTESSGCFETIDKVRETVCVVEPTMVIFKV
jgi:hypothetical protein